MSLLSWGCWGDDGDILDARTISSRSKILILLIVGTGVLTLLILELEASACVNI